MRIEYMLLENFAMVKSGMGLDRLELDFRKFKNVITLIVGNNGTGKTGAVLSNLHPFAGLGHLEARDDSDIIIPGKDGHKVIIFRTKKHVYTIEHFYQAVGKKNKSRKISSYCKKDGKELNPTGLVGTFNSIIEVEFQIDMNFLKLMRLGPNVKNFISLGATDRKSFLAKLLAEVESYIRDQKSASERSTLLNNELKIALDKKKKLDVEDISTLKDSITKLQECLDNAKGYKDTIIKKFYSFKGKLENDKFRTCESEMNQAKADLETYQNEMRRLPKPKYEYVYTEDALSLYNSDLSALQDKRMQHVTKAASLNSKIETLQETIDSLNQEIAKSHHKVEEKELKEFISSLKQKISDYEKEFKDKPAPSVSKEELSSDVDKINMILFHVNEIFELPFYTLEYFKEHFNSYGMDIAKLDSWAKNKLEKVILQQKSSNKKDMNEYEYILYLPENCNCYEDCPYYQLVSDEQDRKDKKARKADLAEEQEALEGLSMIASGLYAISKVVSMLNPKITEYHISMENVYQAILKHDKTKIIDMKLVQSLLEQIEFQQEYEKNQSSLKEAELKMKVLTASTPKSATELAKEVSKQTFQLTSLQDALRKEDAELESLAQKIHATEESIQDYSIFMQYNLKRSELQQKIQDTQEKMQELEKVAEQKQLFQRKQAAYYQQINAMSAQIKEEETEIYNLKMKESTFNQLTEEIAHAEKYFSYTELIKDAVSSKTGIPKVYIMFYCRALKTIANKIISDIYDGELILRDFEITDTKFNIPYYTKGVNVSDIRYASQAEASVATVAISFAILMQFMPKYNIMLLDEIDGPLYETNKEKLFASIEGELKSIGCEQVFMITQSKSYLNYPVNLIITDPDYSVAVTNKQAVIFQR